MVDSLAIMERRGRFVKSLWGGVLPPRVEGVHQGVKVGRSLVPYDWDGLPLCALDAQDVSTLPHRG